MRRVDRLLLRVREAERLDAMQVSVCFVEPSGDKWRAIVDLWDGVEAPNGHTQRLILEAETEEKTQDELNHGHSLFEEYTELTGIQPKED